MSFLILKKSLQIPTFLPLNSSDGWLENLGPTGPLAMSPWIVSAFPGEIFDKGTEVVFFLFSLIL